MVKNYKEVIDDNEFAFKNYKVMCEKLGEPVLTSNSKNKQMKDWLCYFDFHKEKQKIIIDSVKEIPDEIPNRYMQRKLNRYQEENGYCIGYDSKGNEFYFDEEDYPLIKNITWYKNQEGYIKGSLRIDKKGKLKAVAMHRLIMDCPDDMVVDHINHCRWDNRRKNLRICTQQENSFNKSLHKNNSTGLIGVLKRFSVAVSKDGVMNYGGTYDTREEASNVRDELAKSLHGDYACLNEYGDKDIWFALPKATLVEKLKEFDTINDVINAINKGEFDNYVE